MVWSVLFGGIGLGLLFRLGHKHESRDEDREESSAGVAETRDGSAHALT